MLGSEIAMPLGVAPTSLQRVTHAGRGRALARAAADVGTVYTLSSLASVRPRELAEAVPEAVAWFQLYWSRDRGFTGELVAERPKQASRRSSSRSTSRGGPARARPPQRLQLPGPPDAESPHALTAHRVLPDTLGGIVDTSLTWRDLEWLRSECRLPLVVKGILTAEDAVLACEHGCAGMVVSNHGGRQLDGVSATLDALPEVAEAVAGRAEVYLDGGIRRGTDVAMALALGARAVFVGRPALWGLAAGGEEGARHVLEIFRDEIALALLLLGCQTPADVGPEHVRLRG